MQDYIPEAGDVILSSFPKCDTKKIEIILWKLLRPHMDLPELVNGINRYLPCIERVGIKHAMIPFWKRPHLIKTHLPRSSIPLYRRSKYIYIIRNPWDTVVTLYKSVIKDTPSTEESFSEFFDRFIEGGTNYGCFFDHVSSWYQRRKDENVLVLSHELIKSETRSTLFAVAAFLGDNYLGKLLHSEQEVKSVLDCVDEGSKSRFDSGPFIKTFQKNSVFSDSELSVRIGSKIEQKLNKTGVDHMWARFLKNTNAKLLQEQELSNIIARIDSY